MNISAQMISVEEMIRIPDWRSASTEEAKDPQAPDVADDVAGEPGDLPGRGDPFARDRQRLAHLRTSPLTPTSPLT